MIRQASISACTFLLCFILAPTQVMGVDLWVERAKLLASDGAFGDWFGQPVAVSGDTVVVGAYHDDDLGTDSGSAYVFERNGAGAWVEVAKLEASDGDTGQWFGMSVAVSGDTVVVGTQGNADNRGGRSGSAYVFERDGNGAWLEVAKLLASDGAAGDRFGSESVAVNIAVVGASNAVIGAHLDDDLGTDSGSAYVFERDGTGAWLEVAKLLPSDGAEYDRFGLSVAVYGSIAVVGASNDDDLGPESGSAYVFERDGLGNWVEVAKLLASDGAADDSFGSSVSVSAATDAYGWGCQTDAWCVLVVGASNDDDLGPESGSAYVFERDSSGNWVEVAKLLASDGAASDRFGDSVSISGERLVVGASNDDDLGLSSGSAYVFKRDGTGAWIEVGKLLASDGVARDWFGNSVAVSGDTAVVGAIGNDDLGTDSGSAYVFERVAPKISIAGVCPGQVTLTATGGAPNGTARLAASFQLGFTTLPPRDICAGTVLFLRNAFQVGGTGQLDSDGAGTVTRSVTPANCGLRLELLDDTTCEVSNIVMVPNP